MCDRDRMICGFEPFSGPMNLGPKTGPLCPATEILAELHVVQVLTVTVRNFDPVSAKTEIAVQDFIKFFNV